VIDHDLAPVVRLGKCHRQAGPLKANCAAILDGKVEPTVFMDSPTKASPWMVHHKFEKAEEVQKGIVRLFTKYLPEWGYHPVDDTQILTARHAGPLGTVHLNRICQRLYQKRFGIELDEPVCVDKKDEADTKTVLYEHDKVIHNKNNYTLGVMNGTQGIVKSVTPLVVEYDGIDVEYPNDARFQCELAYVLTVHKAQGSEYPCAIVVCTKSHGFQQHRHWLYTAATRAQKSCIIIGDDYGITRAAERVENDKRLTALQVFSEHPETRP